MGKVEEVFQGPAWRKRSRNVENTCIIWQIVISVLEKPAVVKCGLDTVGRTQQAGDRLLISEIFSNKLFQLVREFYNNKISVNKTKNILIMNVDPVRFFFTKQRAQREGVSAFVKTQEWNVHSVKVQVSSLLHKNVMCTA